MLLSYPLTLVSPSSPSTPLLPSHGPPHAHKLITSQSSGRLSVPYVLLYYLPATCNAEARMLYAGAKELLRGEAGVGRVIEIDSAEELADIKEKLGGE